MKLQIIQLEAYDDIISIRDRLSFVETERVLLVFPREGIPLKRKLDLVLAQREAERQGSLLALVTNDLEITDYADELNISVFRTTRAAQADLNWKYPRNKVFVDRNDRPSGPTHPEELRGVASRLRSLSKSERRQALFTRYLVIALLIATMLIGATVLIPGADVILYPLQAEIEGSIQVVADPAAGGVDIEGGIIPATLQTLTVEAQVSIPPTGTRDVPASLASGTVVFTNQTNTEVTIPAGTVVFSIGRDPARYRTTTDVVVAKGVGKTVTATIIALDESAGTRGNLEPNLIIYLEGPLANQLSVRNPDFTRGGTVRPQGIVTQADYESLLAIGRENLRQVALAQFSTALAPSQILVPESITLVAGADEQKTYNAFIGDPIETLTLIIRTRVRAIIVDRQVARAPALAILSQRIPRGQSLIVETVSFDLAGGRAPDAKGRVTFLLNASAKTTSRVDLDTIRQRLAGRASGEVAAILNSVTFLDPNRPPELYIYPPFFGRLPLLATRINVELR